MRGDFAAEIGVEDEFKLENVGEAEHRFSAAKDQAEMFTNQPSSVYSRS